jgi:hypothetical protein
VAAPVKVELLTEARGGAEYDGGRLTTLSDDVPNWFASAVLDPA